MIKRLIFLPALMAFAGCSKPVQHIDAVRLEPGRTEIVLARGASPVTRFAAKELSVFLAKTIGGEIPLADAPGEGKISIVLGTNEWSTAAGIDLSDSPRDTFRIKTENGRVFIAGIDDAKADIEKLLPKGRKADLKFERGTLFGVYEFLERYVGVRFYFPGELGTVVQPKAYVGLPNINITSSPWFTVRHYYQRGDGDWVAEADGEYGGKTGENLNWLRTRMHTFRIPCCHGQLGFRITHRFRDTHPEYLQLRKDGTRDTQIVPDDKLSWRNYHLCQSGPVWNQFYEDILAYFAAGCRVPRGRGMGGGSFAGDYVDVMPQDGFRQCMCEGCQAAYSKSDPTDYASDLIWRQTSALARRLRAAGCPAILTQMAYKPYSRIPDFTIPDNVRVMVAMQGPWKAARPRDAKAEYDEIKAWDAKMGGSRSVWLWTYPHKYGEMDIPLLPQIAPRAFAEYFTSVSGNIFGAFLESESDKTIYNYLNYYVYSRIAWHGKVDVEELLEEHHRLMFAAAAPEMAEFYNELESCWINEIYGRENAMVMGRFGPELLPPDPVELYRKIYSSAKIERWEGLFEAAARKVAADSLAAKRIDFFRREILSPLADLVRKENARMSVQEERNRRLAHPAVNLVANGDFSSFNGWEASTNGNVSIDREICVSPGGSLRLESNDASVEGTFVRACAKRMLVKGVERMKPNTRYRVSFFVKCKDIKGFRRNAGVSLCFHDNVDRAAPALAFLTGTTDWVHVSIEFVSKKNTNIGSLAFVQPRITNATGTAWFDDILIEELK